MSPELRRLLEELAQYELQIYASGRSAMASAWGFLTGGGAPTVVPNPGPADSLLADLWPRLAGPLSAGMVDELQAKIQSIIAPEVRGLVLKAAAGGVGIGFTVARLLGVGRK